METKALDGKEKEKTRRQTDRDSERQIDRQKYNERQKKDREARSAGMQHVVKKHLKHSHEITCLITHTTLGDL